MKTLPISFIIVLISTTLFSQNTGCDTITDFSNPMCSKAVFKSTTGKAYKVQFMSDDENDRGLDILPVNCLDSVFAGKARKNAKISFVTATTEDFVTVSALMKTLAKDSVIRPKVTGQINRIALEKRNVRLTKDTYLFAFKKESDNDYHVIIGDNKDPKKATFFNAEVSGLSTSKDPRFKSVRQTFEKQFVQVCNSSYAVFATNPIKIQIEGSIFYDVDHVAGEIGPTGFKPTTTWEIHPIAKITFLK